MLVLTGGTGRRIDLNVTPLAPSRCLRELPVAKLFVQTTFGSFGGTAAGNHYLQTRVVTEPWSAQLRAGCVQNAPRFAQKTPLRVSPREVCKTELRDKGDLIGR